VRAGRTCSGSPARCIRGQCGLVASVDGLRFVVPVATINAGPNPHYFGMRRGATWLNAVNDRYSGIGAIVVPGTVRDSLYVLDLLLTSMRSATGLPARSSRCKRFRVCSSGLPPRSGNLPGRLDTFLSTQVSCP
jgi:hypothetical protein